MGLLFDLSRNGACDVVAVGRNNREVGNDHRTLTCVYPVVHRRLHIVRSRTKADY